MKNPKSFPKKESAHYLFSVVRVRTYLVKDGSMDPLVNDAYATLYTANADAYAAFYAADAAKDAAAAAYDDAYASVINIELFNSDSLEALLKAVRSWMKEIKASIGDREGNNFIIDTSLTTMICEFSKKDSRGNSLFMSKEDEKLLKGLV